MSQHVSDCGNHHLSVFANQQFRDVYQQIPLFTLQGLLKNCSKNIYVYITYSKHTHTHTRFIYVTSYLTRSFMTWWNKLASLLRVWSKSGLQSFLSFFWLTFTRCLMYSCMRTLKTSFITVWNQKTQLWISHNQTMGVKMLQRWSSEVLWVLTTRVSSHSQVLGKMVCILSIKMQICLSFPLK